MPLSSLDGRKKCNNGLGSLKDKLAAELLLSDSGEEDAEVGGSATTKARSDMVSVRSPDPAEFDFGARVDEDDLEGHLQASVAAQLVAHASVHDDDVAQTVGHDVDVDVDVDEVDGVAEDEVVDDDDDVIHSGGELLDDVALMELNTAKAVSSVAPDVDYLLLDDSDVHR